MKATMSEYNMNDREKHEHISLKCPDYPNGQPILAIHDKNGKVHAKWIFAGVNDLFDFADMIQSYAEAMYATSRKTT